VSFNNIKPLSVTRETQKCVQFLLLSNNIIFRNRGQLKCDGTRAETRVRLSAKRTSPFKSARESVQSTAASRGVCINGSDAGYNMFRSSVKCTGYPLHWPVSPSLRHPCVTVCRYISTGLHHQQHKREVPDTFVRVLNKFGVFLQTFVKSRMFYNFRAVGLRRTDRGEANRHFPLIMRTRLKTGRGKSKQY
jgi:hypothetical protein